MRMGNKFGGNLDNTIYLFMKIIKNTKILIAAYCVLTAIILIATYRISNASKRTLEQQIITMHGIPINLNFESAKAFFCGRDTTYMSSPVKKLIMFADSTMCSGCFIGKLAEYFEVNDTILFRHFQLLVVMHPKSGYQDEVILRLQHEKFPFWCIVDSHGEFIKNNQNIPDNKLLHTFTIDEENRIILVGDPKGNNRIMNLLIKTIES